jgi:hypothetical protein
MSQQQHMQFDDRRQGSPGESEEETYRPRQVNADPREQSRSGGPEEETIGVEESANDSGYEPGYMGQRQKQGEKLQPESGTRPQYAQPQTPLQRRRRRGWLRQLVVVLLIIALLGGFSSGARFMGLGTTAHGEQQSFNVSQNANVVVQNNIGNITIHKGSGNQIEVNATVRDDFLGHKPAVRSEASDSNNISITTEVDRSGLSFFNLSGVDLDITVPDSMKLNLQTDSGNINVEDIQGQLIAEADSGNVSVSNANLSGEGHIQTDAGNINFDGELADNAKYTMTTNAGNVHAKFTPDENVQIDARTDAGNIDSDFPEVSGSGNGPVEKEAHGTIGNGQNSADVTLQTDAGNINIDQR